MNNQVPFQNAKKKSYTTSFSQLQTDAFKKINKDIDKTNAFKLQNKQTKSTFNGPVSFTDFVHFMKTQHKIDVIKENVNTTTSETLPSASTMITNPSTEHFTQKIRQLILNIYLNTLVLVLYL
jgi:hypothetical protein